MSQGIVAFTELTKNILRLVQLAGPNSAAGQQLLTGFINSLLGSLDADTVIKQVNSLDNANPLLHRELMLAAFANSNPALTESVAIDITQQGGRSVQRSFANSIKFAEEVLRNSRDPEERKALSRTLEVMKKFQQHNVPSNLLKAALKPVVNQDGQLTVPAKSVQSIVNIQNRAKNREGATIRPASGIADINRSRSNE